MNSNKQQIPYTRLKRAEILKDMVLEVASNNTHFDEDAYTKIRSSFKESYIHKFLPKFILERNNQEELLAYFCTIAYGEGSWSKRRRRIHQSFNPLLEYLENEDKSLTPADIDIESILSSFNYDTINRAWEKALARRHKDPDGAITMARTLLEEVCKHILDEAGIVYGSDDLPKLYKKTTDVLDLAPSEHSKRAFRQILGSCSSVVYTVGELRNKISDAHGQGKDSIKPTARHAFLVVNLAGAMAAFLVETWQARQSLNDGAQSGS